MVPCLFQIPIDNERPVIACPTSSPTAKAPALATNVTVNFTVTATDNVDSVLMPSCSRNSGSMFPIGRTAVTCNVTDDAGNTASCAFDVVVLGRYQALDDYVSPDYQNGTEAGLGVSLSGEYG